MYNSIVHDHLCDIRLPTFETPSFFALILFSFFAFRARCDKCIVGWALTIAAAAAAAKKKKERAKKKKTEERKKIKYNNRFVGERKKERKKPVRVGVGLLAWLGLGPL